jgi:hypothetical protein
MGVIANRGTAKRGAYPRCRAPASETAVGAVLKPPPALPRASE